MLANNSTDERTRVGGGSTFARRHLGAGDGKRKRHECGSSGGINTNASGHADAGNRVAKPSPAVWNGRWNLAAIADVKLLRDLPASIALQGSELVSTRVIGAVPLVLAVLTREIHPWALMMATTFA